MEEQRMGLVHRVLLARNGINEYAILVTDKRSVFVRLPRSRNGLMLRTEMLFGVSRSDARPRTIDDYSGAALGSLSLETGNFEIMHETVTSFVAEVGGLYPVYHFVHYTIDGRDEKVVPYAVPLPSYGDKERPLEEVLRRYAGEVFALYARVLPTEVIEDAGLGVAPE